MTAEEDQFSLCWNNFNANLSAGFHESLCRGDLVDVTLAAEGQMVKAHRLVLSVCSPYFQKMFTSMPANQHAFVVLKDVSHSALKDLITFMYCGEVNVKHDALPTFITTAEALQIKGLTDSNEPLQSPTSQSQTATVVPLTSNTKILSRASSMATAAPQQLLVTTAPQIVTLSAQGTGASQIIRTSGQGTRNATRLATKASMPATESEESADETKLVVVKRSAPRQSAAVAGKRLKTSSGNTSTTQVVNIKRHPSEEHVIIDLPEEALKLESEPTEVEVDQVEEAVASGEADEETYVEDTQTYTDLKYDETEYFTETDEAKAVVTTSNAPEQFKAEGRTSTASTTAGANDSQEYYEEADKAFQRPFIVSRKGGIHLIHENYVYRSNMRRQGRNKEIMYWECIQNRLNKCRGRVKSVGEKLYYSNKNMEHNHENEEDRINRARKNNSLVMRHIAELGTEQGVEQISIKIDKQE